MGEAIEAVLGLGLIVGFWLLIIGIPMMKILQRVGLSRWYVLIWAIPLVNVLGIWWLAFTDWPALQPSPPPPLPNQRSY
jgi:hypothetical protein